jgi:tetratricopeptide (TPR) repeat protein
MTAAADRHMLFGLLALQNGIINQGQLVAAFQAWTLDKSKSLADHLQARGNLKGATRALVEGLTGRSGSDGALASFDRARATYEVQSKADPAATEVWRGLAASYAGLGRCRALAGDPGDAAEAFSRAVSVLETAPDLGPEDLAELAASHSLLASLAGDAESRLTAVQGQAEVETALATLRRAISLGYRDVARMRTDTDFDTLRARVDFQLILMDMAMPKDPLVRSR